MARRRQGRSQEILAIFAGLHRQEVGLIERGKREPKLTTILKLIQALGVEPNELLKGINPHKPRRPAGQPLDMAKQSKKPADLNRLAAAIVGDATRRDAAEARFGKGPALASRGAASAPRA